MPAPSLILSFLLLLCFTLATHLQPRFFNRGDRAESDDIMTIVLGDGRRMFANHFFVKADVYFHSGYYPSLFDQGRGQTANSRQMMEGEEGKEEQEHEKAMDFLGAPKDWIDRFGRHFYSSAHSHLDKPGEAREILPWLRLSADLDPQQIQTYTVASFWLRKSLNKPDEAEGFLREGLRANPTSYEILFELGQLYAENHNDPVHACNLWEMALRRWQEQEAAQKKPDPFICDEILARLAHAEELRGNLAKTLELLELEATVSPTPGVVKKQIEELKQKLADASPK
ncbi:MAG: hypothetical protein JWR26_3766 [Pedosphaera sp.]|nr:hypothetical protein [Pedosphaera sp.]